MMRCIISVICALFFSATVIADPIASRLQYLLSQTHSQAHIGVLVQSADSGKIYFSKNSNQNFAPASVQKLFTVAVATSLLKPDYRFTTRLMTQGNTSGGVLNGNVIFQFTGDPTITEGDLNQLVQTLQSKNIHQIAGNIVIDDTAYQALPYPPGWIWDDLSYDYAAPLNTVIIDRNRFGLSFKPSPINGGKAAIEPQLPNQTAQFFDGLITNSYSGEDCPLTVYSDMQNQYWVSGCLSRQLGVQHRMLAIRNMKMFTSALIRELLAQHHIQLRGQFLYEHAPANASVITTKYSPPLQELLIHLLKKSDNLYAGTLLKKVGEHYSHEAGSWKNGVNALNLFLINTVGIAKKDIHIDDAAGLSRYDFVTPRAVAKLLVYIYTHPALKKTILSALPIAGVDGTLAGRMPSLGASRCVHAKTGSMTNVSSLAGFVKTRQHGTLAFVILVNNFSGKLAPYRYLENRIVEALAKS
ncbi:MAG: D-alanyl-D-alanine carboxypeptidase/D-alanyl-D-alanine-endopeptidase [Gammaproteobacteria bacterium RIFCSPLOWO2_02_FULL_42_14]|nr:MAG: D-alanyl-D-alanine carboxypeptidase/D-alanyl-D-alanine-endopeptidase [Gammaproteobacteria bacterium RIFCSPHIGHO2_02_FULL_42_43]OGT27866.1 MAG: D-alanyl-D-alanine carboxypeptidase/D-alanyl-D-alanine-endopeptidase [Gammaproteobacteria bacterium RIFCSPHIGHO2_01_FULL_42_8]OGT51574.1 MAG: D-alanyl-D-alanine carboxypeptidase/D-alanyl-D-alanine-endopeptidase [Gammaproteobacteria bacterium RIFCSPHIGHO2_12_FULL_41_25]OGT62273.1 MAG: D-alanyl-D-alanine carboxypeptidase/D-alanyl-D-alanine-endopepti